MTRLGAAVFAGLLVAALFYAVDVSTLAGAHPGWSGGLFASGVLLGTLLAVMSLQFAFVPRTIGLSLLVIGAFLTADYGRMLFTASFAEDQIAGQMWFYGWHVFCIAMVAHVISSVHEQLSWNQHQR